MKYCQECGNKLKETSKNHQEVKIDMKRKLLKAAGVLTIIAASLCFIVAIIGLVANANGSPNSAPYGYYDEYYGYTIPQMQYLLDATFGIFAFILGLASGILILLRQLFSLTTIGLFGIMGAAFLLVVVELWFFVLLGVPILVLATLSMIFTAVSKSEFVS